MKVDQLLEAKKKEVPPDWALDESRWFSQTAKKFGLQFKGKPMLLKGAFWTVGGELKDAGKDTMLSLEKRVVGLQRAMVKRFMELHSKGYEVVTFSTRRTTWWDTSFDPHYIYAGDSEHHIETMIKDRLFINHSSGGGYTIQFLYGLQAPKVEAPKEEPKPRVLRVVKKGQQ